MTELTLAGLGEHVGKELGVSDWVTIDQSRIDTFGGLYRRQPVDPCRCLNGRNVKSFPRPDRAPATSRCRWLLRLPCGSASSPGMPPPA